MNDMIDSTPPFAPEPTTAYLAGVTNIADIADIDQPWHERHPALLVAASIAVGVAAAIPAGSLTSLLFREILAGDCSGDGWCEFGAAIFGLMAGLAAGAVVHIGAGAVFISRFRAPGRRWTLVLAHGMIPAAVFALLAVMSGM